MPHALFDEYIGAAIRNFARYVQLCPASESHHHSSAGGLLDHTLEVVARTLAKRRRMLLPEGGSPEELETKSERWTYAMLTAALLHDVGKVLVDQEVLLIGRDSKPSDTWDGFTFMDEHKNAVSYIIRYLPERIHNLHETASVLLAHKIIPQQGLQWLNRDSQLFRTWLCALEGQDNIVSKTIAAADGESVGINRGVDASSITAAPVNRKPLHEKFLMAFRDLIESGAFPVNKRGAPVWVDGDYAWLICKRVVEEATAYLIGEGHTSIPTQRERVFDVLLEGGVCEPLEGKAIWKVAVSLDNGNWDHEFTVLKIRADKLFSAGNMPSIGDKGSIVPLNKSMESEPENNDAKPDSAPTEIPAPLASDEQKRSETAEKKSSTKPAPFRFEEPETPAPPILTEDAKPLVAQHKAASTDQKLKPAQEPLIDEPPATPDPVVSPAKPSDARESPHKAVAEAFIEWLRWRAEIGVLVVNKPRSEVHIVERGVVLISPKIFKTYIRAEQLELPWEKVQSAFFKMNYHRRNPRNENFWRFVIKSGKKDIPISGVLIEAPKLIFSKTAVPPVNKIIVFGE